MSLRSTLPTGEQVLTEPAPDADIALAAEQDERADLAAYRRARRRARTRRRAPARSAWPSSRCSGSWSPC